MDEEWDSTHRISVRFSIWIGIRGGIAKCLRFRFNSVYQGDELRYESPFDLALRLVAARSDCINFVDKNDGRRIIFSLDGGYGSDENWLTFGRGQTNLVKNPSQVLLRLSRHLGHDFCAIN